MPKSHILWIDRIQVVGISSFSHLGIKNSTTAYNEPEELRSDLFLLVN